MKDRKIQLYIKIVFQGHVGTIGSRGAIGRQGPPVSQKIAVVQYSTVCNNSAIYQLVFKVHAFDRKTVM